MIMPGKIKVLECIRQGQIGGGESHLLSLVENLDRSKFDPVVLSFTDGPMLDRLKQLNVPAYVLYTERPFDVLKWKKIKKFIRDHQIDVVHAHGTRANSNVLWAARSLGIPVVYTVHGWSFHQDQNRFVRNIRVFGEKYLTKRSSLNISVSASNKESGKKFIPSFQSLVINNGIDQRKFNPSGSFKNIRAELGISEDKVLILFIARFTGHKQPLSLIEAFSKALPQNPRLHLLMVGDGDEKQKALEIIKTRRLENNVTLQPFRNDVPAVLAAADIFVLPSLWEGLPIGLLEAMAMGKAVIATNVDGTSEVVIDRENGLMIRTANLVDDLSNALLVMGGNQDLRQQFGEKAIETVNQRFNAIGMTREIENQYIRISKMALVAV